MFDMVINEKLVMDRAEQGTGSRAEWLKERWRQYGKHTQTESIKQNRQQERELDLLFIDTEKTRQ